MTATDRSGTDLAPTSLSSLGLRVVRTTESVIGRRLPLEAVEREFETARRGFACVAVQGEPGIGKTRFLLAVEELARIHGFVSVGVTADEEIRGPFLVARSLLAAPVLTEAAERTGTDRPLRRVLDALVAQDESGIATLPSDQRLLRLVDLAAVALRSIAAEQPLSLLIDDLQWADDDSVRLLRYVARTNGRSPILLAVAGRTEEIATAEGAVSLLADLERMGVLTRVSLARFNQPESVELLQKLLGGPVHLGSAAVMHAQAEGVPFVLTEQVRAYREAGLIQPIDGVWTLARNAERMLPSAVRTLIQRREGRLPEETKRFLSEAALLGRRFSLRDLREVRRRLGEDVSEARAARALAPAVAAGLLVQLADDAAADYEFTHEQVREFSASHLSAPERRAIHAAIVEILLAGGEPPAGSLSLLARHAVAAGQSELGVRVAVDAARAALRAHAADEALRMVEMVQGIAGEPRARVELLRARDEALEMLHRAEQRLEGLAELTALAEALGDPALELESILRRAAALRSGGEPESAAELARRAREIAGERGDRSAELAASLELGQDLLKADLGEAYTRAASEADLDGAEEAFERAAELARTLGDEPGLAAAYRELGIIALSRVRHWFIGQLGTPLHMEMLQRTVAGESAHDLLAALPIAPAADQANEYLRLALELFQKIDDRPGAMNTIIAMAVANWAPEIHLAGSAKRIEEIHRLIARKQSFTNESRRALAEVQMLYGSHVYARAKILPDAALEKGREAYHAARAIGERSVAFTVAGGLALTHCELGQGAEANRWLDAAAELARESPSSWRARELELWSGILRAGDGDAEGMRKQLGNAADLAAGQGRTAHRCEILARLAQESARLGAERRDEDLFALVERTAAEVHRLVSVLPGHPPWGAQAEAALATVWLARDDPARAATHARGAFAALDRAGLEDVFLEVLLPASEALIAGGSETEADDVRERLGLTLGLISQRIVDSGIRVQWFRAPQGRQLAALAGPVPTGPTGHAGSRIEALRLTDAERRLLEHLAAGRSNAEIAEALGLQEGDLALRLAELYVHLGASSRADATASAFIRGII